MNVYEIVFLMWLTLLTCGFLYMFYDILYRAKRLNDTVTKLYSYINDDLDPQIKRIRQLVTDEIIDEENDNANERKYYTSNDILKSDKFSYAPEKRYIIHDCSYDLPGYDPEVKDVCVIVEIDENGRPYYSIRYMSKDNFCHVGYSSYKLKTVLMFLKDYFKCKED